MSGSRKEQRRVERTGGRLLRIDKQHERGEITKAQRDQRSNAELDRLDRSTGHRHGDCDTCGG